MKSAYFTAAIHKHTKFRTRTEEAGTAVTQAGIRISQGPCKIESCGEPVHKAQCGNLVHTIHCYHPKNASACQRARKAVHRTPRGDVSRACAAVLEIARARVPALHTPGTQLV